MIIRAVHDKENPFFLMRRATAQDRQLSFEARGVLAYLFSKPSDWTLRVEDLSAQVANSARPIGRDKMEGILRELKAHGYLRRVRRNQPNGKFEWDTEIYESPYPAYQGTVHQGMVHQGTVHQSLVSRAYTCKTENKRKRTKEREQKKEQQQQSADSNAAAAAAQTEAHNSLHSLANVRRYVAATKRHATNPPGLAQYLWENGREDQEITEWLEAQARRERERQAHIAAHGEAARPERSGAWGAALDEIERRIGEPATVTWFEPLRFDEDARALIAPDPVFHQWIENNYREALDAGLIKAGLGRLEINTANQA